MKLMVQSYNNGGSAYNSEAEETALRSYSIRHRLNEPAEAIIVLGDPSGTIAQKYNVDANDVYIGPGKATIEDPDGTDVFYGRIVRAESNFPAHTVTLYCEDWLSQLDEERITYDMREKLSGNIRQSEGHTDPDGIYVDVAYTQAGVAAAVADDGGAQTDETTEANDATINDMTLLPAVPAVNDAYYFGFAVPVSSLTIDISTGGDGTWTLTWEYYNGAWTALSGVSDGTNGFTLQDEATVSWTKPTDWTTVVVDSKTYYWIRARVSAYTAVIAAPKGKQVTSTVRAFFDDDMTWTRGDYESMYLIFPDSMAGTNTWGSGPYTDAVTGDVTIASGDHDDVWDAATGMQEFAWTDVGTITYDFKMHVGHDTPSNFYVHDSITSAKIIMEHFNYDPSNATVELKVYDNNGAAYDFIGNLEDSQSGILVQEFSVPTPIVPYLVNSSGIAKVQFDVVAVVGADNIELSYLRLELTCDTTGYSSSVSIVESWVNHLLVGTDLTAAATRIWEGIPYCIAQPIYKHLDTAESVGLSLITDEAGEVSLSGPDPLVALTAASTIEHTSGISTRQYVGRTRFEILKDLAKQDKAEFYMALGTATLTYKSTWGANDNTFTDAIPNTLTSSFDYKTMRNEYDVYGMRIGDRQLYSNVADATSIAKYGATRTEIVRSSGLVSEYDTLTVATNRAAQDKDVQMMLSAELVGLDSTYRLGIITEVTSARLGISAVDYIVTSWSYDSNNHTSRITLHPKVSATGLQDTTPRLLQMEEQAETSAKDLYVPEPSTHEVS